VLLDIDTDYCIVDRVYTESDGPRRLPWCWPEELIRRLQARGIVADMVTIPYSVDGGYTPLKWKYLGDELAARLGGTDRGAVQGFERLRDGALKASCGARAEAEQAFHEADAGFAHGLRTRKRSAPCCEHGLTPHSFLEDSYRLQKKGRSLGRNSAEEARHADIGWMNTPDRRTCGLE
jgi:hypothetical protein